MSSRSKFLIGLVVYSVIIKLMPYVVMNNHDHTTNPWAAFYPWNFMPMTALCLYSGAVIKNRMWAAVAPLAAQLLSDLGILLLTGNFSTAFPREIWAVYVCYLITVLLGAGLFSRTWPTRAVDAIGRGILAEVIFFILTNFAYFCVQDVLPHTAAGLVACYIAAIPFAGRSFLSTMLYSVLFFSPIADRATGEARVSQPLSTAQHP